MYKDKRFQVTNSYDVVDVEARIPLSMICQPIVRMGTVVAVLQTSRFAEFEYADQELASNFCQQVYELMQHHKASYFNKVCVLNFAT